MTQRRINLTLKYATATLLAGACVAAGTGFLPLKSFSPARDGAPAAGGGSHAVAPTTAPELTSFEPLFDRPLRAALGTAVPSDNPAAPDPTQQPTAAPPSIAFVGTVGDSLAMIRLVDGSDVVVAVGEHVGGAKLLAIRPTQIDLGSDDGTFTLNKVVASAPDNATLTAPQTPSPTDPNNPPANVGHGY